MDKLFSFIWDKVSYEAKYDGSGSDFANYLIRGMTAIMLMACIVMSIIGFILYLILELFF